MDQNLGPKDDPNVKGTDMAKQLRLGGYTGLICSMSANDTDLDRQMYLEAGCDDCLSKSALKSTLKPTLLKAYKHHCSAADAAKKKL